MWKNEKNNSQKKTLQNYHGLRVPNLVKKIHSKRTKVTMAHECQI